MTVDVVAILRGDPACGDELRQALAELDADGYVLVHRDDLVDLAAATADDGSIAHRVVILARLLADTPLLAETLVDVFECDRAIGTGQLERERAAA